MKFLHTMIRITDPDKSLKFYQEILGLNLSRSMDLKDATLYFLSDEKGSCEIELTHNHKTPENGYEQGSAFGHLAFATNDMAKFTEILEKNNLEYFRPPFAVTEKGPVIAFIKDPDGTMIELIEKKIKSYY